MNILLINIMVKFFAEWFQLEGIFKKICKFGSMNMLISLGTSVAYFASVAMVILSTKQKCEMYETYFDNCSVFDFLFIDW